MLKRVIYNFDDEDPFSLHHSRIEEIHSFVKRYRLPHEVLDPKAINHTPEQKADPNYRGWRALNRIEANGFMRADVEAFLSYWAVILARAEARHQELVAERDDEVRDQHSLKAYDGLIDAIDASIRTGRERVAAFREDIFLAMDGAAESDRHA